MRFTTPYTVIVTGGTSGIGAACTRLFAQEGAQVVFCAPGQDDGEALAIELNATTPGKALYVPCDMRRGEQVIELVDAAVARFGRLDGLINNAGWHPPYKTIDDFSEQDFRDLLDLNVMGVFNACKFALPHLRKTRGWITNIASLVATIGQPGAVTYVATKGAVVSMTKALAIDEARHGVRVNSVSPGNIFTPLWQAGVDASPDPVRCRTDGDAAQLLGRMGTPEEAARLCLFLAADATFTTGVDHFLSGGAELSYGKKAATNESARP